MFICWKNVTSSRIPGAESGGGTLTAFRLLKESVRPAHRESRPGGRGCRAPATPSRAPCKSGRAGGSPAKVGPSSGPSGPRDWVQQGSVPPRDKGWAHALGDGLRMPLRGAARRAAEGPPPPPGPSTGLWGRGRARRPFPAARREDLLMKSSPPSRRRPSLTSAPRRPPVLLPQPPLNPAETTAPQRH